MSLLKIIATSKSSLRQRIFNNNRKYQFAVTLLPLISNLYRQPICRRYYVYLAVTIPVVHMDIHVHLSYPSLTPNIPWKKASPK